MPQISKTATSPSPAKLVPAKKAGSSKTGLLEQAGTLEFPEGLGLKIALYGRSGSGKTTLASTFPGQILYLTCDGGANTLGELRSVFTPTNVKKIKRFNMTESVQLRQFAEELESSDLFSTVVLDTATSYQHLILRELLELDELPPQLSWGIASQQQWGQCSLQTLENLRYILNTNKNVVIIAQEREFEPMMDSGSGTAVMPYIGPAMTPKAVGWLNAAVDYLGQTFIRKEVKAVVTKMAGKETVTQKETGKFEYCLRVGPHDMFTTKFRLPNATVDCIVSPTYEKIMEMILKGGGVV